jgi:large subunit ribosomal protein L19
MAEINVYKLGGIKENLPEMRAGDTVRVSEKILEKSKKKSQVFEGILISKKHGKGINATFTLRTNIGGVGVEKTYPWHSPLIEKIQVIKKGKARRAKLYYLRGKAEKKIRRKLKSKRVQVKEEVHKEKPKEVEKKETGKKGDF